MGMIVQLAYGKANFANTLATYSAQKVTAPFVRVSAVTAGKRMGQVHHALCGFLDLHGGMATNTVEHELGTVLLLQASWKRGGFPVKDGAIFLKLRATAPQYRIMAKIPLDAENRIGEHAMHFMGNADILNESDLQVLGFEVPRQYRGRFMADEEVESCFTISMLSPETAPRAQTTAIATERGVEVREVAAMPMRRLRFGRRA